MGNCSSAPRMKVNLRALVNGNHSSDGCGDEWYFDTMNVLLDRWAYSHVQFLRKRFLEATGDNGVKELDKKGFFKLFGELQDMPKAVAESAFRMFDTDNSGKLNFREFCCALALCCHLMSSDDEKIRFVFDMFDTNDDGLLSANDVQLLLDYAFQKDARGEERGDDRDTLVAAAKRQQRVAEIKLELLGNSQYLTFERFYDWAHRNLDSLNNLLHTFQIVPSPERERVICEEILSRHQTLQEGSTWYCISHKWLQVWKAHAGWTGPSPGRRVLGTLSSTSVAPGPTPTPATLAASMSAVPVEAIRPPSPALIGDPADVDGSEEIISIMSEVCMGGGHHHILTRPPEIDNSDLEGEHKGELKMNLVEHLDYELIPEEMWLRLIEWYGGGPAIMRKVICMGQDQQPQVELYPPLVLVVVAGENGQPLPQFSRRFFISRQSSISEVLQMLAEKLSRPIDKSRLWHRSKGEQWRQVIQTTATLEEFLEGKVWDAGAFLLETQTQAGEWPRDTLAPSSESGDCPATAACLTERELQRHFEVGDRVEAQSGVTNQWLRGTIVDVIQRDHSSAPSQVKVHYDSTVYKCDEWISTSSDRLAPLDTHTTDKEEKGSATASSEGPPPMRGATGLQNLGNTCFLNATIQCLANTPLMKEYFLSSQYSRDINDKGGSKGRLADEFGQVITELWSGKRSSLSPRNLKRTIDQFAPQFVGYEQHDSQEFLAFFLDGLHEDLNRTAPQSGAGSRGGSNSRRESSTPKLFSRNKQIRGSPVSPMRGRPAWKDRGGIDTTPNSSLAPDSSTTVSQVDPPAPDKERDGSSDAASDAASSAIGGATVVAALPHGMVVRAGGGLIGQSTETPPTAATSGTDLLAESYPLKSLEAMAAEAPSPFQVGAEQSEPRGLADRFLPWSSRGRPGYDGVRGVDAPPQPNSARSSDDFRAPSEEGAAVAPHVSQPGLRAHNAAVAAPVPQSATSFLEAAVERVFGVSKDPQPSEGYDDEVSSTTPMESYRAVSKDGYQDGGAGPLSPTGVGGCFGGSASPSPHSGSGSTRSDRRGESDKQGGTDRWWNFAWRRGRGALDLPKEHSEHHHEHHAAERTPSKDATSSVIQLGAGEAKLDAAPHGSSGSAVASAAERGAGTPSPTNAGGGKAFDDQFPGLAGAGASGQAHAVGNSRETIAMMEELRAKLPAGAAASAVAAAAAARVSSDVSEDGMSSATYNESEDFVPELLTPQRGLHRRSIQLLSLSFRRKKSQEEFLSGTGPSSPKRRPRTPPTMMPLREEQHEDRSPIFSSAEPGAGADPPENVEASESGGAAARSFLPPWMVGGSVKRASSQGEPLRSCEGSRDPAEEVADAREGGRSRAREKESSAWPSFLRRGKSRDSARRVPASVPKPCVSVARSLPPSGVRGDTPASDGEVCGNLSATAEEGEGGGDFSIPEDRPPPDDEGHIMTRSLDPGGVLAGAAGPPGDNDSDERPIRASGGIGFPRLRAPWKPRGDRPDTSNGTPAAPLVRGGARGADGGADEPASSDDGDAMSNQTSMREAKQTMSLDASPPGNSTRHAPLQVSSGEPRGSPTSNVAEMESEETPAAEDDGGEEKEVDEDRLPDDEKAALQWERYRARNRSLIVDVFEGQLRSQLTCCKCGSSSSTFEPFRSLSLPIPSNHVDRASLRVVFFPLPFSSMGKGEERQQLTRYSVMVPKSSTVQSLEKALSSRLPVPMSAVLLAEVYRSRIHRYLDYNLPLSDVRAEDQLFAFEILQTAQDLVDYQEKHSPSMQRKERIEDPKKSPTTRVLLIQAMHRRVVDVCRSDGRTWAQRREVFGLPFVMSAASSWTYATLHDMLMLHARRFLKQPRRDPKRAAAAAAAAAASAAAAGGEASAHEERQVPFVARIVNASGTACGACDRRNCTGCLLPKGSARLRLRAGLLTGNVSTAKIYLALDWVDSAVYDQEYVDNVSDDPSVVRAHAIGATQEHTAADRSSEGGETPQGSASVPLSACIDAFAQPEEMKVEMGNGVKCETCNEVVDAVKKMEVWREPDVLILHIKRFHFTGVHFEKLNTPVEIQWRELNIRPWIVGPSGATTAPYELYGVACHSGGMSGGHYISYCQNDEGKEPLWLKFNDDAVTSVSLDQELDEIQRQCYVLFYRKRAFTSSNLINYSSLM